MSRFPKRPDMKRIGATVLVVVLVLALVLSLVASTFPYI